MNIILLASTNLKENILYESHPILNEIGNTTIIEKILSNIDVLKAKSINFIILEEDAKKFNIDSSLKAISKDFNVFKTNKNTMGSSCSALLVASQLNQDDELLIVSTNEIVNIKYDIPIKHFRKNDLMGGLITFKSIHPRYSFVSYEDKYIVNRVAQKRPISNMATTGSFWYQHTKDFVESTKNIIRKDAVVDGLFYLAPTYNEMILLNKKVGFYELESNKYIPMKNTKQLNYYIDNYETL